MMQMNIKKITYLNCRERYEYMIDHRSYIHNLSSYEIKARKNTNAWMVRIHDLCDTGAVLYQLSYQTNWDPLTLWVCNIPVEGKGCKWIYKRSYIWTAEKHMKTWMIIAVVHTTIKTSPPIFFPLMKSFSFSVFLLQRKQNISTDKIPNFLQAKL